MSQTITHPHGYHDDGTTLGSSQNDECRIDAIAQPWPALSGAAAVRFAERAMDAVRTHLIRPGLQLLLLLTPLFDVLAQDPGYIDGHHPGAPGHGSCAWGSRMSLDQSGLDALAAETGFRATSLEKVVRLAEIVEDVAYVKQQNELVLGLQSGDLVVLDSAPQPRSIPGQ